MSKGLKKEWKVLLPIYLVLFVLTVIVPSVVLDISFAQQTTAFETGQVASFIALCAVYDLLIWMLSTMVIIIVSAVILVAIQLVRFLRDTLKNR